MCFLIPSWMKEKLRWLWNVWNMWKALCRNMSPWKRTSCGSADKDVSLTKTYRFLFPGDYTLMMNTYEHVSYSIYAIFSTQSPLDPSLNRTHLDLNYSYTSFLSSVLISLFPRVSLHLATGWQCQDWKHCPRSWGEAICGKMWKSDIHSNTK